MSPVLLGVGAIVLAGTTAAGAAEPPAASAAEPPAASAAEPRAEPATHTEPATPASPPAHEPDPRSWHQSPAPVLEEPRPVRHVPKAELGVDGGVASRPSKGEGVHYAASPALGIHLRADLFQLTPRSTLPAFSVAARAQVRWEWSPVSFDDGALGLPSATQYDQPAIHRVALGLMLEPTVRLVERLDLYAGVGVQWARATAPKLRTSGAEVVVLPIRSAVLVEFPFSLGVRVHLVPDRLVFNLRGAVSFLSNQSGNLERPYETPGSAGKLVTVQGFPAHETSLVVLAGIGVVL